MLRKLYPGNTRRAALRAAFTVLEMLIAMAVTLLMMAALTRAFKVIGDSMQSSRANVQLSSRLRTISFRVSDELSRSTATLEPPRPASFGEGYFCYFEGPMSDSTMIQDAIVGVYDPVNGTGIEGISRDDTQASNAAYFPLSRYGDLDDYIAFTAAAQDGTAFKGIVPAFVVIYKERELATEEALRLGLPAPTFPALTDAQALQPVVIESKYAEIVYWVSPARDSNNAIIDVLGDADVNGDGIPDGDGVPDTLYLRRRVLLVRPDLNLSSGFLATFTDSNNNTYMDIGPGLRSLTPIHQQCDLAVRRPESAEGVQLPVSGRSAVIANSIADLTLPQNRFAHVRVPEGTAPFTNDLNSLNGVQMTSMPVLDLLSPEGLLSIPGINSSIDGSNKALTGFLNYAYELGGNRLGEDVVLSNIVGFDVRGFDTGAPSFVHVGADGVPGSVGDDDGDGQADFGDTDYSEFGFQGSDDVIITPNDPGFYALIRQPVGAGGLGVVNASGDVVAILASSGGYVDLNYAYQAAGNVIAPVNIQNGSSNLRSNLDRFCESPLSGFAGRPVGSLQDGDGWWLTPTNYWKSGKLLLGTRNNGVRPAVINQATYDTWARDYETDRHNQGFVGATNLLGTLWVYNYQPFDPGSSLGALSDSSRIAMLDPVLLLSAGSNMLWPNQIDEAANGVDETGSSPGVDDRSESEAPAPIDYHLPGIQIRIRVIDQDTQSIRQVAISQHFSR